LSLWRGPALADFPDEWVVETRRALDKELFAASINTAIAGLL
jgi:transcriptional activator